MNRTEGVVAKAPVKTHKNGNYSEEELIDLAVNQGYGVKGLSEMRLSKLPSKFIQPLKERMCSMVVASENETISVIDMSSFDDDVADMICEAATRFGFFQVVNHGVPSHVMEHVMEAAARFFELPAEEKGKYLMGKMGSNNVRVTTSFLPHLEKVLEWKDSISMLYVNDEEAHALWPSACRDEVLDYMSCCDILFKKLLSALMNGINIQEIDPVKESRLIGSKRVNVLCYPACPNSDQTVGVGRHSDVSTLTVLLQDATGGLYIRKLVGDGWIHVKPVSGSLVINIGDALQIMSNGMYKSVEHRVFAPTMKNRFSVAVFANPKPTDLIGPLPEALGKTGGKLLYKEEVLYSDYVKNFYKNAHDGKSTLDFARV